eukprot:gnl/MRDRNA2_/MRDRNA2_94719_c0_seq1.p1 gnl/MRDRNA2_/MRDRNA2_94719_c0~~gnl/MRDRNA2_/MRDRNA2_94719_c0_seq1.p1  ORF type:complete len:196 (-),score=60.13 gnl/MRDRNA2_/MRDRNA2_94719_c0_seq1:64-651(-)
MGGAAEEDPQLESGVNVFFDAVKIISDLKKQVKEMKDALNTEREERKQDTAALMARLQAEADARKALEQKLSEALALETRSREDQGAKIESDLAEEKQGREAQCGTIHNELSNEVVERTKMTDSLRADLDTEKHARSTQVQVLGDHLNQVEAVARDRREIEGRLNVLESLTKNMSNSLKFVRTAWHQFVLDDPPS